MSTLAVKLDPHAVDISVDEAALHFILVDGREISAPLDISPDQRKHWRLIGKGIGVHWPEIDEESDDRFQRLDLTSTTVSF